MPVVTTDSRGVYVSRSFLSGESPGVSWMGGVGVLLPAAVCPRPGDSVASILEKAGGASAPWRLWKAGGQPVDAPLQAPVKVWIPVS